MALSQVKLEIKLNKAYTIPATYIKGFHIYYSINTLPYGWIDVGDVGGLLKEFPHLQIGAKLDYSLTDITNETKTNSSSLVILYIDTPNVNLSSGQAQMKIYFGHAWYLYKTAMSEAYPPQLASEVIKSVLKKAKRGIEFKTRVWCSSDGNPQPWYKFGITDLQFIRRVLSKTTIRGFPVHFFCDEDDLFNLTILQNILSQKPVLQIMTENAGDGLGSLNIPATQGSLTIGVDDLDGMKRIIVAEDKENATSAMGTAMPYTGKSGDLVPLDIDYFKSSATTSQETEINNSLTDALSIINNHSVQFDSLLTLKATIQFSKDIKIGQAAYVNNPNLVINGTWAVAENRIDLEDKVTQSVTLIRNKFYSTENIKFPKSLYKVV